MFDSVHHSRPKTMLRRVHNLLDDADVVIHYNGSKFDIPTLNKEFLLYGMSPPAPYKQLDLLKTARSQFKFPSNKLDYVAKALGLKGKTKHIGHELWVRCMNNDPEAWKMMEEYNKNDVVLLEKVYEKLRPWTKPPINYSVYTDELVCPHCGHDKYQRRGYAYTASCKYARYQCKNSACKKWFQGGKSLAQAPEGKFLPV
jgi:hypothetical protein